MTEAHIAFIRKFLWWGLAVIAILGALALFVGSPQAGDAYIVKDTVRAYLADSCITPPPHFWNPYGDNRPSLTIFYVDTVGCDCGILSISYNHLGQPFDTSYHCWTVLDTVIVGTVYLDKMPDKHKLLKIRKDQ